MLTFLENIRIFVNTFFIYEKICCRFILQKHDLVSRNDGVIAFLVKCKSML